MENLDFSLFNLLQQSFHNLEAREQSKSFRTKKEGFLEVDNESSNFQILNINIII